MKLQHRFSAFALAALAASAACSPNEPTEIVAGVSTQIRVPEHLRGVGLVVQVGGRVEFCEHYPVTDGLVTLPATLGVVGKSGLSARGTVTVQVVGLRSENTAFERDCVTTQPEMDGLEVLLIRRRRLTFVDNAIKFLPLPLKESCADTMCGSEETCVGGKCVSADIEARDLPNYDDRLIFGNTNTCFDANRCMPSRGTVPVRLEDPETCTFSAIWPEALPDPVAGGLNVRLFYNSFGSEILDVEFESLAEDQREGFSFSRGEDEPLVFQLAPNLCESNYQLDKVLAIDASALCPAKRALQPICDDYVPPDPRGEGSSGAGGTGSGGAGNGGGDGDPGICTLAGLIPVESVIYVLMDRSQSMSGFFSDGSLRIAVELPLSNPIAKRTKVGFAFLPPEAEQCGTADYASPMIPIGEIEAARAGIGDIIQNGRPLDDNPSQFFLEAALQGAYQGVRGVRPDDPTQGFNRRAVVVISNRDVLGGPCPGPSALTLAEEASSSTTDRIFTYAVALDDGEAQAVSGASALATAGGTTVFDGVNDEAEGARAVQDILTELGTCLYAVRRSDATPDERLPETARVSYIDPSSPSTSGVDIDFNPLCADGAPDDVSGWNYEGNLVRLCGAACENLRQIIGDVGVFHAAQGLVPPAVPLVATGSCEEFHVAPADQP